MNDLKNTPWHTVLIQWDRSLHKVVDSEGFTIVEETDEPTAKAIAALPDTLKRLGELEDELRKKFSESYLYQTREQAIRFQSWDGPPASRSLTEHLERLRDEMIDHIKTVLE